MIRSVQIALSAGRGLSWQTAAQALRLVHCARCLAKAQGSLEVRSTPAEHRTEDARVGLNEAYTEGERDAILDTLNNASEGELSSIKLLRGKKSSSLVQYRKQHGPFLDLDSLVQVPYFQSKIAVKVFDSILNAASREQRKERKPEGRAPSRLVKPSIPAERLEAAESIVSIVFGTQKIAWAHMERNMNVCDWQQEEFYRFMKGTYHGHVYLEDISPVVSKIPRADFYVLEKPGIPVQNSSLFPVTLHLHMVEATLYALLNMRYAADGDHCVVSMARTTVGKHFGLMVGESRTSGVDTVKQLINASVSPGKPWVTFSQELILRYRHQFQTRSQKRNEEMCDALLQAITFYDLVT
ncbi:transcription elongation factor, mitochondrial [Spea bombifrons]|uniref:transcription elongation factor, mitochondrial n=1 Tax=Spea bombifrons TaxID=233779 RepID=UPI002349AC50|nr:transcription elongation factor, mitochondrial [Spea bombifrons]